MGAAPRLLANDHCFLLNSNKTKNKKKKENILLFPFKTTVSMHVLCIDNICVYVKKNKLMNAKWCSTAFAHILCAIWFSKYFAGKLDFSCFARKQCFKPNTKSRIIDKIFTL